MRNYIKGTEHVILNDPRFKKCHVRVWTVPLVPLKALSDQESSSIFTLNISRKSESRISFCFRNNEGNVQN